MTRVQMAVAAASFASVSLLSFGWSADEGLSLTVAAAQAAPQHVAMHRHYRHRYGANPVAAGANVAAGVVGAAIGTAGAIAAAPFGGPYYGNGYYSGSTWGDHDCGPGRPGCRPYAERWR
jgi:hypothetical protein